MAPDALRLTPNGATLDVDGLLREPLRLTLGQLQIGLVDRVVAAEDVVRAGRQGPVGLGRC